MTEWVDTDLTHKLLESAKEKKLEKTQSIEKRYTPDRLQWRIPKIT